MILSKRVLLPSIGILFCLGFTDLALAQNFMDVNTIMPAMMIDAGGTSLQVGVLTAIMIGGTNFSQLLFLPFLSNKPRKKGFLLFGVNLRIIALLGLGVLLYVYSAQTNGDGVFCRFLIAHYPPLVRIPGELAPCANRDVAQVAEDVRADRVVDRADRLHPRLDRIDEVLIMPRTDR